jgi:beta-glucosidase
MTAARARLGLGVALVLMALPLLPGRAPATAASCPWVGSTVPAADRATAVLRRMTQAEKVQLVTGTADAGPAAGRVLGISRLCIPSLVLNDAGAGIGNRQQGTTAYPDGIAQAATWDVGLVRSLGQALGTEAVAKGVNVVLAPGVNIARTPLGGRNFEYAGEDPYLAGQTAAAVVRGLQSRRVVATVKHFLLNDQEAARDTMSSDASERTLQEIYLPPFEAAVRQGGAGAVMCSYNRVNGSYGCENPALLRGLLKQQLGFTGWVVSDFKATHSTVASAQAGLDMEMPTAQYFGSALASAVRAGRVPAATLDGMVRRVLTTMFRLGLVDHPPLTGRGGVTATTGSSLAVARRVAQDGTVLLKNDAVLPLSAASKRIAVIGSAASPAGARQASQGYGSGHVPQFAYHAGVSDPLAAITARAARNGSTVSYADGSAPAKALLAAATSDVAVVFVNDVEVEGADRLDLKPRSGSCSLTGASSCSYSRVDQDALVSAVAAVSPRTVVVLQSGGPVEMPWLDSVGAVVENWYPGQVDGDALAPLLFGDGNFSGKLPVTFPVRLSDGPVTTPQQYPGVADARGVPHAVYSEGLLVGYRWYDAKAVAPLFAFGHGLSYTTFRYSGLSVLPTPSGVSVRFTVTNSGRRAGAEVAQVYVSSPATAGEPPKQLKGFRKVTLGPGRSATVTVPLEPRAFAVWSTSRHAWTVLPGCYSVRVGGSSQQLPLVARVARAGDRC